MNPVRRARRARRAREGAAILPSLRPSWTVRVRTPSLGRLHLAVATLFALDGAVFGSWAARVPDVSDTVGATSTTLGFALFCVSAGALASMQLTGLLCARLGAGIVCASGTVMLSVAVVLPGISATLPQLSLALLVFGAVTGAVNVAANSLGVQVQAKRHRPILSGLHASFSFGGLAGALIGGLASGVPVPVHLIAVGCVGLIVAAKIAPVLAQADPIFLESPLLLADKATERAANGLRPLAVRAIVALGAIAGCTAFAEGALSDWGALHLRQNLHTTPAFATAGYAGFCLAMACGRLSGRRWIIRYGDTHVLVGGALVAAAGVLGAALSPSLAVALLGFALVGLGLANIFPLAIARAGLIGGARGVALTSSVGYSGLLAGPPVIGFLAAKAGLPLALSSISALALVAAWLAFAFALEAPAATTIVVGLRAQSLARLEPASARTRSRARHHADVTAPRHIDVRAHRHIDVTAHRHADMSGHHHQIDVTASRPATGHQPLSTRSAPSTAWSDVVLGTGPVDHWDESSDLRVSVDGTAPVGRSRL